jgi:hypothetical protein
MPDGFRAKRGLSTGLELQSRSWTLIFGPAPNRRGVRCASHIGDDGREIQCSVV